MINYLYYQVKTAAHPGSITEDLMDYIKPVVGKESTFLVIHSGANDLTNVVNTMKEIRKLLKFGRNLDKDNKGNTGFSRAISRSDKKVGQKIRSKFEFKTLL